MLTYPEIDPVALALGPLQIHWYGLTYLLSFLIVWRLFIFRAKKPWSPIEPKQAEDLIFNGALGVVIGGRLGYVFFYKMDQFLADPLWLFRLWEGGMSFHGGLLGVLVALYISARLWKVAFLQIGDFVAPMVPVGLFFGRIGNFIGQELWGRPTDGWWAMVFPSDPTGLPRHPSQLYEAALEGLLLFILLWFVSAKPRPRGLLSGCFLLGYGSMRFLVEFARAPDPHLADLLLFGWVSRGQVLSTPMIFAGLLLIAWSLGKFNRTKVNQ